MTVYVPSNYSAPNIGPGILRKPQKKRGSPRLKYYHLISKWSKHWRLGNWPLLRHRLNDLQYLLRKRQRIDRLADQVGAAEIDRQPLDLIACMSGQGNDGRMFP